MDKISVVMTTYNGEAHIIKQLESLKDQTRIPDEVLIFDDQSSDQTIGIIKSFLDTFSLPNWKLTINTRRLGWKMNFAEGIKQANGTFIFLCDQDDYWYKDKIEKMTEAIRDNDHILLLACDYNVIYEPGALKVKIYKKNKREAEGLIGRYEFKNNFFMTAHPGCSYVLRNTFVKSVIDQWFSGAPHDEFLWLMATIQDGAYFYNEPLMDYIRYAGNSSEIRYKDIDMQIENIDYIGQMLEKLKEYTEMHPENITGDKTKKLDRAIIWCNKRKRLMTSRNPIIWLLMVRYWRYYNSARNCLSDLWLVLFGRFERKTR